MKHSQLVLSHLKICSTRCLRENFSGFFCDDSEAPHRPGARARVIFCFLNYCNSTDQTVIDVSPLPCSRLHYEGCRNGAGKHTLPSALCLSSFFLLETYSSLCFSLKQELSSSGRLGIFHPQKRVTSARKNCPWEQKGIVPKSFNFLPIPPN